MMNLCALFSLGERVCAGAGDHAGPGADAPAQGASLWDPARGGGGGGGARGGVLGLPRAGGPPDDRIIIDLMDSD
jgi:hypothetical protein